MPTYEYKCKQCDNQFELWQEVGADAPPCPECGAEVQKVFHPVRTIFKGSGFYITDSRPPVSKTPDTKTDSKETKEASSGSEPAGAAAGTGANAAQPASAPVKAVS